MTTSTTAFAQIGHLASQRPVHAALAWLHLHEQRIMRWQSECAAIPAPPFAEGPRATWIEEQFRALELDEVHVDEAGNVLGMLHPVALQPQLEQPGSIILLSAHMDTIFPGDTPLAPVLAGHRLEVPGACDNGAGLAALLALAAALRHAAIRPPCCIVFLCNVGEEGEGDLRGMRHIYAHAAWRARIAAHLVLDGAGQTVAVTDALGSRRFEVTLSGSGGHSWTDAGRPNPLLALSDAVIRLQKRQPTLTNPRTTPHSSPRESTTDQAVEPRAHGVSLSQQAGGRSSARTTWNIGIMEGGSSVNAIPAQATARFDLRSTDPADLLRLEVELHRAVEDAVLSANKAGLPDHPLRFRMQLIGDRPAGALPADARILALLRAVDRHLGLRTELRTASTDANVPLSLGVEALSLGAGGAGGGIHTTAEWFDARGRDVGLRRILLLLLALADCHQPRA